MKNLIISGASGFVGSSFCKAFQSDYKILPLSRATGFDPFSIQDYMDAADGMEADAFIHMGGPTSPMESRDDPYQYFQDHLQYATNVAEFVRRKNIPKLIYLNTYVYGNPQYLPIDEKHPVSLPTPYHQAKMTVEDLFSRYIETQKTKVISLRIFNVYGSGQPENMLLPSLLKNFSSGTVEVSDLEPRRDFIYVKDLTHLIRCIIMTKETTPEFSVYNIGSGKSYSVGEVIQVLQKVMQQAVEIRNLNKRRPNEIMDCVADVSKANRALGWKPCYDLEEGLIDMLQIKSYV